MQRAVSCGAIDALAEKPPAASSEQACRRDDYRVGVGDHRIIYAIDEARPMVLVARMARRRYLRSRTNLPIFTDVMFR